MVPETLPVWQTKKYITTWREFDENIRAEGRPLLRELGKFPDSVLITGCQRSGTTMLTRVLTLSSGMVNYWFSPDDELDAALILSGYVKYYPQGRHCFQTTYVGPSCNEYIEHQNENFRIVFVLRNPHSVVYSMLYNWSAYALNQLFILSGVPVLQGKDRRLYQILGLRGISRLRRACWGYYGKLQQVFELRNYFGEDRLLIVDYDQLVIHKEKILPAIYDFSELTYKPIYAERIHNRSLAKTRKMSRYEHAVVAKLCNPIYDQAQRLVTPIS